VLCLFDVMSRFGNVGYVKDELMDVCAPYSVFC
jgi:hypothetical protein